MLLIATFWVTVSCRHPVVDYNPRHEYRKGDRVAVLRHLDFSQGSWKAIVRLGINEWGDLPEEQRKSGCWVLTDIEKLRKMQREWIFEVSGGDAATITSGIWLVQDGEVRWTSGLDPRGAVGLQDGVLGWASSVEPSLGSQIFQDFSPLNPNAAPILISGRQLECGAGPWTGVRPNSSTR